MTDADFEWFEYKYPGWYDKYGKGWENYNRLATPNGHHPIVAENVDYVYPHRCWTCMVPCLVREDMTMAEVDWQWRHYCHKEWNWADVVSDMGYVRDDGKTMTAQPHLNLDPKKMWTLDHLRRMPEVLSPNVLLNEMSAEQREAFHADYIRQGPAGRPAPAAS